MITALSSGGLGDIVYSIPVMRELGVELLYVKQHYYRSPFTNLYEAIKSLVEFEGFKCQLYPDVPMYSYPVPANFDLDTFRKQPGRGRVFIQDNMRRRFQLQLKAYTPWLSLPVTDGDYSVIHLTDRWRGEKLVDWNKVLQRIEGKVYFIGLQHEWADFCYQYGNIEWYATSDVLEMAELIAGCKALYCNQSVSLTLAQGLGKSYFLEAKPGKTNTLINQPIEHLL